MSKIKNYYLSLFKYKAFYILIIPIIVIFLLGILSDIFDLFFKIYTISKGIFIVVSLTAFLLILLLLLFSFKKLKSIKITFFDPLIFIVLSLSFLFLIWFCFNPKGNIFMINLLKWISMSIIFLLSLIISIFRIKYVNLIK